MTVAADRCERCICEYCSGPFDKHDRGICSCEHCTGCPDLACLGFERPHRIDLLAQQMGLLLSVHLGPKHRMRCLVAAHAAHHAIEDYDTATEGN